MNLLKLTYLGMSLALSVLFAACSPQASNATNPAAPQHVEKVPIFELSEQDPTDIQALLAVETTIDNASNHMEQKLVQLQHSHQLTPQIAYQHKRDNIAFAQQQLKQLKLKTAQGQYIQKLMQEYWQQQAKVYQQDPAKAQSDDAELAMQGVESFIQAQEHLQQWAAQYALESS